MTMAREAEQAPAAGPSLRRQGGEVDLTPPTTGMTLITYQDRIVAIADANRLYLAPAIDELANGDPLKTFVCFLALYARDVQTGALPGDPASTCHAAASVTPAQRSC